MIRKAYTLAPNFASAVWGITRRYRWRENGELTTLLAELLITRTGIKLIAPRIQK
jgi:hypothetical protein